MQITSVEEMRYFKVGSEAMVQKIAEVLAVA